MRTTFLLTSVAAALAAAASSQAATIYSTSFETPTYTAGSTVAGVDGWTAGSGGGASQTVSTAFASSGTQSLVFDNTGTNNSFYSAVHQLGAFAPSTLTLSVDVYIPSTNGADRSAEIEFSTGTLGSGVLGISIDGAGEIRMGTSWAALYSTTVIAATAPAGTYANRWLTATLTFNPATAAGTVALSGFGGTTPSYSASYTGVTTPTNVNLGSDYIGTTARAGQIGFDRLSLVTAVPEPSTWALMVLAGVTGLGVTLRRRARFA